MNKTFSIFFGSVLIALFVAAFVPCSFAQESESPVPAPVVEEQPAVVAEQPVVAVEQSAVETLAGTVVAVYSEDSAIVLQYADEAGTQKMVTFSIGEKAEIKKGDSAVTVADIKENDAVSVKFSTDATGKKIINSIMIEVK